MEMNWKFTGSGWKLTVLNSFFIKENNTEEKINKISWIRAKEELHCHKLFITESNFRQWNCHTGRRLSFFFSFFFFFQKFLLFVCNIVLYTLLEEKSILSPKNLSTGLIIPTDSGPWPSSSCWEKRWLGPNSSCLLYLFLYLRMFIYYLKKKNLKFLVENIIH